jgi:hypothetical protein
MNDSADIKTAADRLQSALRSLEGSLGPLLDKVSRLETEAKEAQTMTEDRAVLAAKLDESTAKEESYAAREKEFNVLADETTQELDRVIRQVRTALGEG